MPHPYSVPRSVQSLTLSMEKSLLNQPDIYQGCLSQKAKEGEAMCESSEIFGTACTLRYNNAMYTYHKPYPTQSIGTLVTDAHEMPAYLHTKNHPIDQWRYDEVHGYYLLGFRNGVRGELNADSFCNFFEH